MSLSLNGVDLAAAAWRNVQRSGRIRDALFSPAWTEYTFECGDKEAPLRGALTFDGHRGMALTLNGTLVLSAELDSDSTLFADLDALRVASTHALDVSRRRRGKA